MINVVEQIEQLKYRVLIRKGHDIGPREVMEQGGWEVGKLYKVARIDVASTPEDSGAWTVTLDFVPVEADEPIIVEEKPCQP